MTTDGAYSIMGAAVTQLERQIRIAKHRLWSNKWLCLTSWTVTGAGVLLALTILVQRLFGIPIVLPWAVAGLAVAALIASTLWTAATRESDAYAAARLDEAAGLRERISSGRFCLASDDPFARAVVADAARISGSLSVRQHIPLVVPKPFRWSLLSILLALAMGFVPVGVLKRADATAEQDPNRELESVKVAVKKQLEAVRELADVNPALPEDLKVELSRIADKSAGDLRRPNDVRNEAIKKIEALADAVKHKRQGDDYQSLPTLERKLRGLRTSEAAESPTQKLTKSLREGDFKSAKEEIAAMKEQLATLKSEQDKEMAQKLGMQLDQLSKQLESLSKDERLADKLEKAGIKKNDVQRMLENLKKEDIEQLKKDLEEKGMDPKQVQNLVNQLQQQKQAGSQTQKLAQSMKQAGQSAAQGQNGEAISGLSEAEAQLSELEQMQQAMAEMESSMKALQAAKESIDKPCSQCRGSGKQGSQSCSKCQGDNGNRKGEGGMGPLPGQGRGGLAAEEPSSLDFKVERAKVHSGKGAIIGQFQMDGEQLPGELTTQLTEVVAAAERDASDRIQRDRIPRQYQKAIKTYFSNARKKLDDPARNRSDEASPKPDKAEPETSPSGVPEPQPSEKE